MQTSYSRDALEAIWTVNYAGKAAFNNDFTIETRRPLQVGQYFIHDLALTYDLSDVAKKAGIGMEGLRARFIVKNVFDKEPPFGTTGLGTYDVIGRYFQFGVTGRF